MEKLQQAVHKAREQRAIRTGITPGDGADRSGGASGQWDKLRRYEPTPQALERARIVGATAGRKSTHFDILRTKALLGMSKNGWKRLAVTSPTLGSGKTTTSINLALGLSRRSDMRAILFEFDLRRPTIGKRLGLPPSPDISEMLAGRVPFEDQAVRVRDNVAIAAAAEVSPDPSAVLLNQSTHDVLSELETSYAPDLMIFDLPPVLSSDETRALLKEVDCALIVARAEATTTHQIDACEREIQDQTNVLGVVLNQCRHMGNSNTEDYY